ncbi:MAG: hypothetical protein AAB074_16945 [Planctomycetota bacterium]
MRILLSAAFIAAAAAAASADTVWLKNGGKLEGVTTSMEGDKLVVKMPSGVIKLDKDQIEKIVHRATAMEEYELAAAKLKKDDAKGHAELANWCADKGLTHFEREELEAVIAADPDNADARKRLNYEKVGGKWLRGEELLKARGMVKIDCKWMSKEVAAADAAAKEKKKLERQLAEAEKKAKREAAESEDDRLRAFYESQERVQRRMQDRDNSFDHRRSSGDYSRRYYNGYRGGSFWAGTVGYYPYGYYYSPGYYYPGHYHSSAGIYYSHGNYSFSFGTSHYGGGYYGGGYYGGGYYPGTSGGYSYGSQYQGAGSNSFGPVGPGGNSSGNFSDGGPPQVGGSR